MDTSNKSLHNNSVNCTDCHIGGNNRSIHPMTYMQPNASFNTGNSTGVNCYDCHIGTIINTTNLGVTTLPKTSSQFAHSENLWNGSLWNQSGSSIYWDNTSNNSACYYCHNDTKHDTVALGKIDTFKGSNTVASAFTDTWCIGCHVEGSDNYDLMIGNMSAAGIPVEITGNATNGYGDSDTANDGSTSYFNHTIVPGITAATDATCKACHDGDSAVNITPLMHNISSGGYGAGCIECHGIGAAYPRIDNATVIDANAIHVGINNDTPNPEGVDNNNKICWACHMTGGISPTGTDHAQRKTNADPLKPYWCYECHNGTAKPNSNVSTAPNVTEHFPGGDNIIAAYNASSNTSSCLVCHNKSEMRLVNNEPDSVYSNYSLVSHYGKNRSDIVASGSVNCTYCHQNPGTNFTDAMYNYTPAFSANVLNHSTNAAETPDCNNANCHDSGRMHDSSLKKPALTDPSSDICLACHSPDNYIGNASGTGAKEQHNDSLDCTQCHINNTGAGTVLSDIHGIKYLQNTGNTWTAVKTSNVVDCTTCHQSNNTIYNAVNATLGSGTNPPRIPTDTNNDFNHSDNASAGERWSSHWTIDDNQSACMYCHNDTKHMSNAFGNTTSISSGNSGDIGIGYLCAGCHYTESDNYNRMETNYTSRLPPSITNGTNWEGITDGYYNHSLSTFTDTDCKACHGSLLSTNFLEEFVHNVAEGGFGPNCISCHDVGKTASKKVNVSLITNNSAIHRQINSDMAGEADDLTTEANNSICWACHMTDGLPPSGNDHANRLTNNDSSKPYKCDECHNGTPAYNNVSSAPVVKEHFKSGDNLTAASNAATNTDSCIACHNESIMRVGGPADEGEVTAFFSNYSLVSHYGKNQSSFDEAPGSVAYCQYCHNGSSEFAGVFTDDNNMTISNHSLRYNGTNPSCATSECHNSTGSRFHDAALIKPAVSDTLCLNCHGVSKTYTADMDTSNKSLHNNSVNCTDCHIGGNNRSIHPMSYLQDDGTNYTNTTSSNATGVNCITCHQENATAVKTKYSIPLVHDPLSHSNDEMNGSKWNTSTAYWTTELGSCNYCHNDTKHDKDGLGKLAPLRGNNTDLTDTICVSCHKADTSMYSVIAGSSNFTNTPPNITSGLDARDGTPFFNHTSLLSSTGDNDSVCKGCHGNLSNPPIDTTYFAHDVYEANTTNCVSCHDAASNTPTNLINTDAQLNVSAMNNSPDAIHFNLNNANTSDDDNLRCYACHGNGTSHPILEDAKECDQCHVGTNSQDFSAPKTGRHIPNASDPAFKSQSSINVTGAQCWDCHNNSVNTSATLYVTNKSRVSHYGIYSDLVPTYSNGSNQDANNKCYNCHNGTEIEYLKWFTPVEKQTTMAEKIGCYECHSGNWIYERYSGTIFIWKFYPQEVESFHNETMGTYWACSTCH